MRRARRQCYYDARVNDVNLRDITSSESNANILEALRDGQPNNLANFIILLQWGADWEEENDDDEIIKHYFVFREGDDLGWLGHFIRRSQYLERLVIMSLPERGERSDELVEGIAHNRSIHDLHAATELWDPRSENLGQFIGNSKTLSDFGFSSMDIGLEHAHSIASAIRQMMQLDSKSMKSFSFFKNNIISDEAFVVICGELRSHPQLEELYLYENDNVGRNGCMTLGSMLSSWNTPNLQGLDLRDNSIDDRGLQALVGGMVNCCNLEIVKLSGNDLITAAGLRSLSTFFQSENCSLEELWLERMNVGDDGATALAEGLVGNKLLEQLRFDVDVAGITEVGWSAFSKLLCDSSSINRTYLSNHTLEWIGEGDDRGAPEDVVKYLEWNVDFNEDDTAIWKILKHFNDYDALDIDSLFQWKLKFLPLLVTWFKRARSSIAPWVTKNDSDFSGLEKRKLSAVHKFVRGMPLLIIDGYNSRRTSTRLSRKRQLDGETK
jgi:hypothetical protein